MNTIAEYVAAKRAEEQREAAERRRLIQQNLGLLAGLLAFIVWSLVWGLPR